jgi:hypothetical protein
MAEEGRIPEEEREGDLEPDLGDEEEPEFELHGGKGGGFKTDPVGGVGPDPT